MNQTKNVYTHQSRDMFHCAAPVLANLTITSDEEEITSTAVLEKIGIL